MEIIGHGATLALDTTVGATGASGDTFLTVAGATSLGYDGRTTDILDNTAMDTPGIDRVYGAGLRKPGELNVKLNARPTDASQITFRAAESKLSYWKVTWPEAVLTDTFAGYLSGITEELNDDKTITISAKISISGAFTRTVAA